jgi:hypothetical protein
VRGSEENFIKVNNGSLMFELTTSCGKWKYILISNIITKFKEVASDNMELIKLVQFVIISIQFV